MSHRLHLAVLALLVCTGCATNGASGPFPEFPVKSWQVQSASSGTIYFRNDGKRPVTIAVITLTRCVNTRETCKDYPVNLTVEPGQTVVGMKVGRFTATQRWSFGFAFQAGNGRDATVALTPDDGIPRPTLTTARMPTIPAENFVPVVAPTEVGARCVATRGTTLPKGHRVLAMMFFPTRGAVVPVRAIDVIYDGSGAAYEYKDLRGEINVVQLSQTEHTSSRSTLVGGGHHTKISLDLLNQTGTASNSDDKGKETLVRLSGPNLLTAESLGRPGELIAWIWKECKHTP